MKIRTETKEVGFLPGFFYGKPDSPSGEYQRNTLVVINVDEYAYYGGLYAVMICTYKANLGNTYTKCYLCREDYTDKAFPGWVAAREFKINSKKEQSCWVDAPLKTIHNSHERVVSEIKSRIKKIILKNGVGEDISPETFYKFF
jgi:hypothetical protein